MKQEYSIGEVANLKQFRVKVLKAEKASDGDWWYTVEAIDLGPRVRSVTREVHQDMLRKA